METKEYELEGLLVAKIGTHIRVLLLVLILLESPAFAGDSLCQKLIDQSKQECALSNYGDIALNLDSVQPYVRGPNDAPLSDYSLRCVQAFLKSGGLIEDLDNLIRDGVVPIDQRFALRQLDLGSRKNTGDFVSDGKRANAFFIRSFADDGLSYVEPIQPEDQVLLDHSNIFARPREAYQWDHKSSRNRGVRSMIYSGNGMTIEFDQILLSYKEFARSLVADSQIPMVGTNLFLVLHHVHPLFEARLEATDHLSGDIVFPLSGADRHWATTVSRGLPGELLMIVAIVPNGYKYSALFRDGQDITDQIEYYIGQFNSQSDGKVGTQDTSWAGVLKRLWRRVRGSR